MRSTVDQLLYSSFTRKRETAAERLLSPFYVLGGATEFNSSPDKGNLVEAPAALFYLP